jgi:hypothetical protein
MIPILILVGALVLLKLLGPFLRLVIAAVAGKAIGKAALAKQPDTIRLIPAATSAWRNAAEADRLDQGLRTCGFSDGGTFTIPELPGIVVRLFAHAADSFYAALYDHPQAGVWIDVGTRYADGSSATFSTSRPTGLAPRPGHAMTNMPGASPAQVVRNATSNRPRGLFAQHSPTEARRVFETAYAESMAWRKAHGVSTREVVEVAKRTQRAA